MTRGVGPAGPTPRFPIPPNLEPWSLPVRLVIGTVRTLYTVINDLEALGPASIAHASHVEPILP
jgi:hypothetical protein